MHPSQQKLFDLFGSHCRPPSPVFSLFTHPSLAQLSLLTLKSYAHIEIISSISIATFPTESVGIMIHLYMKSNVSRCCGGSHDTRIPYCCGGDTNQIFICTCSHCCGGKIRRCPSQILHLNVKNKFSFRY